MSQITRKNRFFAVAVLFCVLFTFLLSAGYNSSLSSRGGIDMHGYDEQRAYALVLTSSKDVRYFVGTRVMIYQLLHSGFAGDIPVVVLVTEDVTHTHRARLRRDGARVVPIQKIHAAEWMDPAEARWKDVLTKLRIYELTEYDKICYLDTDILITQNIDGVFEDEATRIEATILREAHKDTGLPPTYMFAARPDSWDYSHSYDMPGLFNGGFLVFQPSKAIFEYYISLSKTQDLFDWGMMDQSLVNYAHRQGGPMPWRQLREEWTTDHPGEADYNKGIKSFHDKFWDPQPLQSDLLRGLWEEQVKAMEAYWQVMDIM